MTEDPTLGPPVFFSVFGAKSVSLRLNGNLYHQTAIARAAFRLTDRASCLLSSGGDSDTDTIWATFIAKQDSLDLDRLVQMFLDELLDQKLRHELEITFGDLRLLITAQAFSEGNLLNPEDDTTDFRNDPRAIGRAR
jgi:His-Xaa-Ser system protein HxsD